MTAATDFHWPVRVYYEDTDAGGVVYHANYLKFMERARTEWLRELGFEQDRLRADCGVVFAVRRASLDMRRPARFNEALEVTCEPRRLRRASVEFVQVVRRDGEPLVTGEIMIACVDPERAVPAAVPESVYRAMHAAIATDTEATG
ncbi:MULTISPECIES: tol-pal system-associated acyl-CoA thioesterase [unclassified Thioalkalivibrio]|uniref:tol-pal system-associated acyl-CoA thioesterase n=1 Tax=unclassified Thioalkalivibrio TaxID=2621013 RepID=UPI00037107F5|nr:MULTISPECIES: tol-pal system-associated acyl-CoA thioesterase [unclassified Thioalkalivibrio]